MRVRYKASQNEAGETSHEVLIESEFAGFQVELPTRGDAEALAALMGRAKLVSASVDTETPALPTIEENKARLARLHRSATYGRPREDAAEGRIAELEAALCALRDAHEDERLPLIDAALLSRKEFHVGQWSLPALILAGQACSDYAKDMGECHICQMTDEETHESFCPLSSAWPSTEAVARPFFRLAKKVREPQPLGDVQANFVTSVLENVENARGLRDALALPWYVEASARLGGPALVRSQKGMIALVTGPAEARETAVALCHVVNRLGPKECAECGKPAACFGSYETELTPAYACNTCCQHGNEDGACTPLSSALEESP